MEVLFERWHSIPVPMAVRSPSHGEIESAEIIAERTHGSSSVEARIVVKRKGTQRMGTRGRKRDECESRFWDWGLTKSLRERKIQQIAALAFSSIAEGQVAEQDPGHFWPWSVLIFGPFFNRDADRRTPIWTQCPALF